MSTPGKPRLRAWYRPPQFYTPTWGVTGQLAAGKLQHGLGGYWDTLLDGAVYEIAYGHCGEVTGATPSRYPPGKRLGYLTWEPHPLLSRYRPGDVVHVEPDALPRRSPSGWTARKLKLAQEVA